MVYGIYLGPKGGPISPRWGLCIYEDTRSLRVASWGSWLPKASEAPTIRNRRYRTVRRIPLAPWYKLGQDKLIRLVWHIFQELPQPLMKEDTLGIQIAQTR